MTLMYHCNENSYKVFEMVQRKYHYVYGEKQGEETRHTFYMYRKIEKGYYIDHTQGI